VGREFRHSTSKGNDSAGYCAQKNGWNNFEFIQGDVNRIGLPDADAATAFWCMISISEYQMVLENIISSLLSEGRLAVLD